METFFAHGKLLLSAEYAILHGAKGIAFPLNKGQRLQFYKKKKQSTHAHIKWTAFDQNNYPWFVASFDKSSFKLIKASYLGGVNTLTTLLKLIPTSFFKEEVDYHFETYLDFDKAWGWGTSSTMVSLIAQCTGVDPYLLYKATFKGSGFDLACATADGPISYRLDSKGKPEVHRIEFAPHFEDRISFVYLGKKQNSLKSIQKRSTPSPELLEKVNRLTEKLLIHQQDEALFRETLEEHENLLAEYLGMETIKNQLFPQFSSTFKSLGAWGGDFVMMIGEQDEKNLLKESGYSVLFSWDDIML